MLCGPFLLVGLAGAGNAERLRGDVLRDGGACTDVSAAADLQRGDEGGVAADKGALAHDGLVLLHAVKVRGGHAAAEVAVGTGLGVAEVGQMGHLGIFAQTGVFQLDKAACPDAAAKLTAAAHAGIGTDDGVLPHAGLAHLRGVHHGARADDGIVDDAPRADDGLLADDGFAAQHRAGQQARAGSDAHGRLDIAAGCVIDLHARAGEGQQAVALQQARDLRQLGRGGDGIHGLLLVHGGAVVQQEAGKGEMLVERLHQLLAGDAVDARDAPCGR